MTKPKVLMSKSYIMLTIKGMEYVAEITTMKKFAKALKGIKEVVPGL